MNEDNLASQAILLGQLLQNPVARVSSFIGEGILPKRGGRLLFGGPAGLGKSLVISNMIYDAASGWPIMGLGPVKRADGTTDERLNVSEPIRVLYIENEVGLSGLQVRFNKIHAMKQSAVALNNIFILSKSILRLATGKVETSLVSETNVESWFDVLNAVKPQWIVGDPLATLHTCDENSNQEMNRVAIVADEILEMYRDRTGIEAAWGLVHHFRKRATEEPVDMALFRGAGRIADWADTRLLMEPLRAAGQDGVYHNFRKLIFSVVRQGPEMSDIWTWIDLKSLITLPAKLTQSSGYPLG
ncbi:MAG: helicase RepA family protein [Nitrososphaera sp.]|nr:helicase RepA family protein [Nitrososphaera sp.]